MPFQRVAIMAYVASGMLLLFALFAGNIRVETVQSNGLPEILYPYSEVSLFATLASIGVFFFGVILSLAILGGRAAKARRPLTGSGFLSVGVLVILNAMFWYRVNLQDSASRCIHGCAPSLLQYDQGVLVASTILSVLGLAAAGFGIHLLRAARVS
jgi:uncharacterized membrane protein